MKKRLAITIFIILIVLLSVFYVTRTQKLKNFVSYDYMDSVRIKNGTTGVETVITDTDVLAKIKRYLKKLQVKRTISLPSSEYSYCIDLYNVDMIQTRLVFTGKHKVTIDGSAYGLTNDNEESVESFLAEIEKNYIE